MVRDDDHRGAGESSQVVPAAKPRPGTQKSIGEQMMDALGEWIPRVVVPPVVSAEPGLEREQAVCPGAVDFALERNPDLLKRE